MDIVSKKRFVNEMGIEVKLASYLLQNQDFVELEKQEDGSFNITIKKISLK